MKHIIIQIESIMKYPPTISLMKILKQLGENVILYTSEIDKLCTTVCEEENVKLVDLKYLFSSKDSAFQKLKKMYPLEKSIKKQLKQDYDDNTIIWVMTSITLKYIGKNLNQKRYIMYMYELSQEIYFYNKIPFFKVQLEKLFRDALAVIECEYNRAHIAQAWFGLKKLPYIVPNKPYMKEMKRKSFIQDEYSHKVIEEIKDRKIILYQGIIDKERPLDAFIEAVDDLGDEYALVIMSGDCYKLKEKKSNNLYLLPFVNPPHHLEITSWSHIGILTYYAVRNETTSPLNAIYCAPNKIYEYAMFGIPMLGNDVPGLQSCIGEKKLGKCIQKLEKEDIINSILDIEKNYATYSMESRNYYVNTDNYKVFEKIISDIRKSVNT